VRRGDKPVVDLGEGIKIEDECVFRLGDHYEMLCKDCTGKVTGEYHATIHLLSPDGVAWKLAPNPKAWSRTIVWTTARPPPRLTLSGPSSCSAIGRRPGSLLPRPMARSPRRPPRPLLRQEHVEHGFPPQTLSA